MKKILFTFFLLLIALLAISCDSEQECRHENVSQNTIAPTCTESGYTQNTCNDCAYSFLTERSDPTGHTFSSRTVSPTCVTGGYTEYTCECGASYVSEQTSALGHDYSLEVTDPTCVERGYTKYTCKKCNLSHVSLYTSALGHTFEETVIAPTCDQEGYTEYKCACGYFTTANVTKPTGHNYKEEVISLASCTETGEIRYTCECSDTYTLTVAPTGHSFSRTVTMPTLSDMGSTIFNCSACGYEYIGEYRFYSDILANAYSNSTDVLAKGIDVSYHNYKVDGNGDYISLNWEAIKASGISYVIIRAGDAAIGIDPTFEKSYAEAKAAGLDVGVYFYTRATSVHEITLEANLVLSALQGKQFEYPIYLDLEDESLMTIHPSILNEMCMTFFTTLQRAGYYTGLYVNDEWLYNLIDKETALSRFEIWYARYPKYEEGELPTWNEEEFGKTLGMWQYTDNGTIDGIDHTVFDMNYSYKDYPSIIKEYGFSGYDGDFKFHDTGKTFVWVSSDTIKVRSKADYFTSDEYDASLDVIGYAEYGSRFEVVEKTEQYTAIIYNGTVAYISANPKYISFDGLFLK